MVKPKPVVRVTKPRTPRLFYAIGLCFVLAAIGQAGYHFFAEAPYFRLSHLQIEGVSNPIAADLQKSAEKFLSKNSNLLNLDVGELARAIGSHPRVRNLRLTKLYPDTLVIRAAERQPTAVVNAEGFFLVDGDGFVMEKLRPSSLRSYDFPYVTGLGRYEVQVGDKIYNSRLYRALELIRVLRERNPDLYARFSEVHLESDTTSTLGSISAQLKGGTEVRFGEGNPIEKLPTLEFFIRRQQEQKADPFTMAYVDLRFKNQIVYMDRATALAAATGLLDKIRQEQADEIEKLHKQNKETPKPAGSDMKPEPDEPVIQDENPPIADESALRDAKDSVADRTGDTGSGASARQPVADERIRTQEVPTPDSASRPRFSFWRRSSEPARSATLDEVR